MGIISAFRKKNPPPKVSESDLHQLLREGGDSLERGAKILYGEFRQQVLKWVQKHGGSEAEAHSVFQMGIEEIMRYIVQGKFEKLERPRAVLFGICKNKWYQECRRKGKTEPLTENLSQVEQARKSYVGLSWDRENNRQEFQRHLAELKGRCKDYLIHYYYQNMSNAEIATRYASTENAVKARRSQCMRQLKARIRKHPEILDLLQKQHA